MHTETRKPHAIPVYHKPKNAPLRERPLSQSRMNPRWTSDGTPRRQYRAPVGIDSIGEE